ncbi:MAG: glycerol-3-phosphate acyltransferase [Ruminococcus sp.]|nr:glycerol-3-phosphate acyltransferase [Ruminococcus sp.]
MNYALCALLGYLTGNINPSYIIARLRGFDIRSRGSGNAGASNALMTMGLRAGIFSALFDISKAAAVCLLAEELFPETGFPVILAGCSCITGHIFPVFMHFRGGKGLACLGGTVLAFSPSIFAAMLAAEVITALLLDYICVIPITGSVIFTAVYAFTGGTLPGTVTLALTSLIIIWKHKQNLCRIQNGTEIHLSYLWHRDRELERIKKNEE